MSRALVLALALLAATGAAVRAEEIAVRTPVVLRERADEHARVVTRVAAGTPATLLARGVDGGWLMVRVGKYEGWANKGFFTTPAADQPASAAPKASVTGTAAANSAPLAPPIAHPAPVSAPPPAQPHVDGWVNEGTYYRKKPLEAVALRRCDVHARTDEDSHVVTALDKGQRFVIARLSTDEAWGLVRGDGADVGWVQMAAVRVRGAAAVAELPTKDSARSEESVRSDDVAPRAELHAVARPPEQAGTLALGAGAGFAVMGRRFASNGTAPLAQWELSTSGFATVASADWSHRLGRHGLIGIDANYVYAGGARVQFHAADGSTASVRMQLHDADAGLRLGVHARAAGGLDFTLRAGVQLTVTILDPDANLRLTSDRLIAPTVGLGFAAPRLVALGRHWLGLAVHGRALVLGQRTENLGEGAARGTWGGDAGARLALELWHARTRGELAMAAAYSYRFSVSQYEGPSQRDPSATRATLGAAEHLATLSLVYAY
jgi:hypothetical protein